MKIKTSTLEREALDWAVAKCVCLEWPIVPVPKMPFNPSTNWSQGGPIIERECINAYASGACSVQPKNPDYWVAEILDTSEVITQYGPTPLIAAMRCYCASKLGEEVEVPDELVDPEQDGDDGTEDHDTADRNPNRDGF